MLAQVRSNTPSASDRAKCRLSLGSLSIVQCEVWPPAEEYCPRPTVRRGLVCLTGSPQSLPARVVALVADILGQHRGGTCLTLGFGTEDGRDFTISAVT